jgi:hypothetical protein
MSSNAKTLLIVAGILLVGYLAFAKGGAGVARVKTWFGKRKAVVTGTASKGDDSGGVLTAAA